MLQHLHIPVEEEKDGAALTPSWTSREGQGFVGQPQAAAGALTLSLKTAAPER